MELREGNEPGPPLARVWSCGAVRADEREPLPLGTAASTPSTTGLLSESDRDSSYVDHAMTRLPSSSAGRARRRARRRTPSRPRVGSPQERGRSRDHVREHEESAPMITDSGSRRDSRLRRGADCVRDDDPDEADEPAHGDGSRCPQRCRDDEGRRTRRTSTPSGGLVVAEAHTSTTRGARGSRRSRRRRKGGSERRPTSPCSECFRGSTSTPAAASPRSAAGRTSATR